MTSSFSRPTISLIVLAAAAAVLFAGHFPLLGLPLFWDELGQFVPSALDLFYNGKWVPTSAVPNVHPPGLEAYLSLVWHFTRYSIPATRAAMLALSALTVLVTFLLASRLCGASGGGAPFVAAGLLLLSPLFFMQSMMAQLDLPATLFTLLGLLLFLQDRIWPAAFACTALALFKETGLIVPIVFGLWLLTEKRFTAALRLLLPALALAAWLFVLHRATGRWLGNDEFAEYNVFYALHPARIVLALLRRLYFLFVADFHWVGWIAVFLAWRRTTTFRSRQWSIVAALFAAHVLMLSVAGGAVLERYLLPILPLAYIGMAAAWRDLNRRWCLPAQGAMAAGFVFGLFWNPPYAFPFENNLAMVDFVRLHQDAARYLETNVPDTRITTAWPFSAELRRPEYGYVRHKFTVQRTTDFRPTTLAVLRRDDVEVLALYSRDWEPRWNLLGIPLFDSLRRRFYGYEPQVTSQELWDRFGVVPLKRWGRGGQWIEVYASPCVAAGNGRDGK